MLTSADGCMGSKSKETGVHQISVKPYAWAVGIVWSLVVAGSLLWAWYQTRQGTLEVASSQARVAFEKDITYRRWNASHGGVYVPVNEKTAPNPYLKIPERDVTTTSGVALTMMNPAYMTRQVHELATEAYGIQGHITSLDPIRPGNAPDAWETKALEAFRAGVKEVGSVEEMRGESTFRLMRPLMVEESCLKCHSAQGYQVGDIRGGISVSLPMAPYLAVERSQIRTLLLGHGLLWLCGLAGIWFGTRRLGQYITERGLAEEALCRSEERFRRVVESSPMGIHMYRMEPDGRLVFTGANPSADAMLSIDHQGLVGKTIEEAFPALQYTEVAERYREVCGAGAHWQTEQIDYEDDRVKGIYEVHAFQTAPGTMATMFLDVTERKRAEEALRTSEEKYRLVVENAHDAIFIAQDGFLKFPNPRLTSITNYSPEELTQKPFMEFIHPDDRELVLTRHQRRLGGEKVPDTYSFRVLGKSGDVLWVELSAVLINWEGRPASLNFMRDITLEKKLETQLLHAQKMESIGTLAGGVAHDFNNLLMGILGNASLMMADIDPNHPHYEKLKSIEHQVRSGSALNQQLLGFARGGKYEVKPSDLNDLVVQSSDMFGRTHKEIIIHRLFEEDLAPVEMDCSQIEQVLINLYVNAWQAMPGGGTLSLETRNVLLDQQTADIHSVQPGRYVRVSVTDTGIGMDEATQERIFDPFFTTKEMGHGTGLGLASVYGIISNHNGFITVRSEVDRGSTFTIYLPSCDGVVEKSIEGSDIVQRGSGRILVVDDQDVIIDVTISMLKGLGYDVISATNGYDAITIYEGQKDQINLVILDMIMPMMSGGDTFERLRQINPDVKIILSSGYSVDGQAKEILDRGCSGFIQKPFTMLTLSQKIQEILS
jgi:two-component system, cell cycle sensor histidine kinase and response regulator CckA